MFQCRCVVGCVDNEVEGVCAGGSQWSGDGPGLRGEARVLREVGVLAACVCQPKLQLGTRGLGRK